jgi:hypothetical protein
LIYLLGFITVYLILSSLLIRWAVTRFNTEMAGREYSPSNLGYYLSKHAPLMWKIETKDEVVAMEFRALKMGVGHMLTLLAVVLGVFAISAIYY